MCKASKDNHAQQSHIVANHAGGIVLVAFLATGFGPVRVRVVARARLLAANSALGFLKVVKEATESRDVRRRSGSGASLDILKLGKLDSVKLLVDTWGETDGPRTLRSYHQEGCCQPSPAQESRQSP